MTKFKSVVAGVAALTAFSMAAPAAGLAEAFTKCVDKFANPKTEATVMLECNAADGKVSDCKVVENSTTVAGFDKAAICVADSLPIGSKTGTIRVPVKFNPRG
ncbi:hypothetical protein FHS83_002350 [Rhizomicrobium palustre]|uniref:TonB C-terminal domain-containing protein n=1 Tax=Rhizomicrobium palustre TaxID=189966 RepID=A0A846N1C6_9PROT|nr:energy transducer TonB [Rhizomicrobium palustre]NIK89032.1 hypothetical protein [Rhizomicrobium palustre]